MKYLKLFDNETGYEEFVNSNDYVTPNICAVKDGSGEVDLVFFNREEDVNLITFYVGGTAYQCEEGMTWEEFVSSNYNVGSFYLDKFGLVYDINGNGINYGDREYSTYVIVANRSYDADDSNIGIISD